MNKLVGGHTNHTDGGIPELVAEWEPAVWLVLDPTSDWGWASENLRTRFAWRPYIADIDFNAPIDPKQAARMVVATTLAWAHNVSGGWWQGVNEPVIHSAEAMRRYADFECERVRLLAGNGLKAGVGSFAVGNPYNMAWWRDFLPAMDAARQYDGFLFLHEYWWDDPLEPWTALRHRKIYEGEPSHGWAGLPARLRRPLIITEAGRDYGVVEPGVVKGWAGVIEPTQYVEECEIYDAAVRADPYVVGAAVFCCGNRAFQWTGYDIWPEVAKKLAARADPVYRTMKPPQPDIINLVGRLPVHPTERYNPMRKAKRTIIHHVGFNYPGDRVRDSIRIIRSIARQKVRRGWPGGPYHFYVDRRGRKFQVNDLDIAAHHAARFNPTSYGIGMMNGNHLQDPTPEMVQATKEICIMINKPIKAHNELMKTYCPGDLNSWWWRKIKGGAA